MQIPVPRRFVTDLTDTENVDQIFIANEKQLRTNRNGNLYLQVRLSDRTGSITAMLWNAQQKQYDSFENGDYITVQGTAQLYNATPISMNPILLRFPPAKLTKWSGVLVRFYDRWKTQI